MKPTSQAGLPVRTRAYTRDSQPPPGHHIPKSPLTDWSFQVAAPALRGGRRVGQNGRSVLTPGFRQLMIEGLFSAESRREARFEGALFGVIVALATWPIVLAVQAGAILLK
jgi:hypothetical protein